MREKFYGLLREYMLTLRERDVCEEQVQAAPEGIEQEQAKCQLELIRKRSVTLRREIKRYPNVHAVPLSGAPNHPLSRYSTQPA